MRLMRALLLFWMFCAVLAIVLLALATAYHEWIAAGLLLFALITSVNAGLGVYDHMKKRR